MPRNGRNIPFTFQFNTASTWAFQFIAAPAFPFTGDTLTSISRHFSAAFRSLSYYISHLMAYFNQVMASAIFTLQAFLQLKYQGVNDQNQSSSSGGFSSAVDAETSRLIG